MSEETARLDWVEIAKLAGKHGIRYPTNAALEAFLADSKVWSRLDASKQQQDNFRVHLWTKGRDKGRVSCPISTYEQAEAWIADWKSVGSKYENDDLRIHDLRSVGHIRDSEDA